MHKVPYLEEYPFRDENHVHIHDYSNPDYMLWVWDDGELTAYSNLQTDHQLRDILYEGFVPNLMRVLWTYSSGPLV